MKHFKLTLDIPGFDCYIAEGRGCFDLHSFKREVGIDEFHLCHSSVFQFQDRYVALILVPKATE